MSRFTVVLDACVLYPAPLRDALMRLALTDLFKAHWTDQRIPDPRSTNQRINESTNQRSTIHDPRSTIHHCAERTNRTRGELLRLL